MKASIKYSLTGLAMLALAAGAWWWVQSSTEQENWEGEQVTAVITPNNTPANPPARAVDILHPQVQVLITKDNVGSGVRAEALEKLPNNLSVQDLSKVTDFMNAEKPAEMQSPEWHALVDSLINVLRRQDTAPEGLTDSLVQLYHNGADSVLKDYAVQYLRYWFVDRETRYKHETRPEKRELILATLIDAAHKLEESYSGTALMALDHVTTDNELSTEPETQAMIQSQLRDFNGLLFKAVSSPETNKLCRISAIQVAAMRGVRETLPVVRTIAADPAADPNVRISAIAAIGQLGDLAEDKELLTRLEKSGQRLAYAAKPALQKLSSTP